MPEAVTTCPIFVSVLNRRLVETGNHRTSMCSSLCGHSLPNYPVLESLLRFDLTSRNALL